MDLDEYDKIRSEARHDLLLQIVLWGSVAAFVFCLIHGIARTIWPHY